MTHPFEYRAHYRADGTPCHCPWGIAPGNEHLGSVKEASKLEWLEGRPGMEKERNQFWLNWMKGVEEPDGFRRFEPSMANEKTDKLLPWLHREFNKGRLLPWARTDSLGRPLLLYKPDGSSFNENEVISPGKEDNKPWMVHNHNGKISQLSREDLAEMQSHLEEMQKRKKGIDIMQHKVHELVPKVDEFRDWKAAQEREDRGEVLHRFDDGWTIRRLQNDAEHEDEGEQMGHCIGGHGYCEDTANGNNLYVSLRDHKNLPHASLQISPDHWKHESGEIAQGHHPPGGTDEGWIPQIGPQSVPGEFYGKEDSEPLPEYQDRVNEWLRTHHAPEADGGPGEAEVLHIDPADDLESYHAIHGEDGSYFEYAPETDDQGRPPGENTHYEFSTPDYDRIAYDLLTGEQSRWQNGVRQTWHNGPKEAQELFNTARYDHSLRPMHQAIQENHDPEDPEHQPIVDEWNRLVQSWYHPYTGELSPGGDTSPIKEFQNPLWKDIPEYQRKPEPYTPYDKSPMQGPMAPPVEPWQRYTSNHKPLYYRWVYSPTKGVTINSNQDDHPAFVKYHGELGGDINDTDLEHGYASAIGNGWRITNLAHQAVEDPYIVQQVVRRLNLEDGPEIRSEGSWQPAEYDFERLHYGLPCEKFSS